MGDTVPITAHPRYKLHTEPTLSKRQLSEAIGYTERWIEILMQVGLPSELDARGRRRYRLSDVQAFLSERKDGAA